MEGSDVGCHAAPSDSGGARRLRSGREAQRARVAPGKSGRRSTGTTPPFLSPLPAKVAPLKRTTSSCGSFFGGEHLAEPLTFLLGPAMHELHGEVPRVPVFQALGDFTAGVQVRETEGRVGDAIEI